MPFAQWGYPHQQGEEKFRGAVPRRLHLRGDRPDPRLVLHADGGRDTGLRPVVVRHRALPRPHPGRGRPQDEQAPRQHPRADPADGSARRRRGALVHARRGSPWSARRVGQEAIGEVVRKTLLTYWNTVSFQALYAPTAPAGARHNRRRPLLIARRWTGGSLARSPAAGRDGRRGARRRSNPAGAGAADRHVRRRAVELVRPPLAAAVLGRRLSPPCRRCTSR